MARQEDWWTGTRAALLVVLGLATGTAVVRQSPTSDATPAKPGAGTSLPDQGSAAPQSDRLRAADPVVALLADAIGVDLEDDSTRQAALAWRDYLRLKVQTRPHTDDQYVLAALDHVLTKWPVASDPLVVADIPKTAVRVGSVAQALQILRAYSLPESSQQAEFRKHKATILDFLEGNDRRCAVARIQNRASSNNVRLDMMIATLPDYVDSQTRRLFDSGMAGVQSAAYALGYSLVSFHLPDWNPADASGTRTRHEVEPGALLFRRVERTPGQTPDKIEHLLLVLIVAETPTFGVHRRAFMTAVELFAAWRAAAAGSTACRAVISSTCSNEPSTLKILGPFFSGTTASLAQELRTLAGRSLAGKPAEVRVLTGSASNLRNRDDLAVANGMPVTFGATVADNRQVRLALATFLERLNPDWRNGHRVAILVEANTAFGQDREEEPSLLAHALTVRFPLHISRLRGTATPPGAPAIPLFMLPALRLKLDEGIPPKDVIPSFTPEVTAPVVESALRNLLDALRRERYTAVGIFATDVRDHLFLAREITRALPDVLMFGTQSDLLYVNPEFAPFTRGTVIASAYPLFNATQLVVPPMHGRHLRHQFSTNAEQGVYNAAFILISNASKSAPPPDGLIDYGQPGLVTSQSGIPPVWLSVVGTRALWPLDYRIAQDRASSPLAARDTETANAVEPASYVVAISNAVNAADEADEPKPSTHASSMAVVLFAGLNSTVLIYIVGLRIASKHQRLIRRQRGLRDLPAPATKEQPSGTANVLRECEEILRRALHWRRTRIFWFFYPPSHVGVNRQEQTSGGCARRVRETREG